METATVTPSLAAPRPAVPVVSYPPDLPVSQRKDEIGTAVGYKVRFTDKSSDSTLIKVMTDGILLAEMQRDRRLLRYDTLIIDEAHERSLNIDFILGYLKRLL